MKYSLWFPTYRDSASFWSWFGRFHQPAYRLDSSHQGIVDRAIREVCLDRGWQLLEIEVTAWEVSVVLETLQKPERVIHHFKIAAGLALASLDGAGPSRKRFDRRALIQPLPETAKSSAVTA